MFFRHLNTAQKCQLVVMAYRMMVADHRIREEEQSILATLEHHLGVKDQVTEADFHKPLDPGLFDSHESRVAVMLELFAVAYSDRVIHAFEVDMLRHYAREFGFGADMFERMSDWTKRHILLLAEAKGFLSER